MQSYGVSWCWWIRYAGMLGTGEIQPLTDYQKLPNRDAPVRHEWPC